MQVNVVVWLRRAVFASALLASQACLLAEVPSAPPAEPSEDAPKALHIGEIPPISEALADHTTPPAAPAVVPTVAPTSDKSDAASGSDVAPATLPELPASAVPDEGNKSSSESGIEIKQPHEASEAADAAKAAAGDKDAKGKDTKGKDTKGNDTKGANGSLKPIPAAPQTGPITIEAASFKGVTPGVTSIAEVEKAWGSPKEMRKHEGLFTQLFAVEPFDRVEVSYYEDKVTSVIIRLGHGFPSTAVAEQLELQRVRPVLVSNDIGEILGQVYPERGVLFAFEPNEEPRKPSMKVTQIILEPINAEPFVLRAETDMESDVRSAVSDLEQALKLQPENARGLWLYAQVLTAVGKNDKALTACSEAVRHEPDNPRYRVTRAQVLSRLGRIADASDEAEKAVETGSKRPHVQARALCLLGDLAAAGAKPDYKEAMRFYMEAVKTADALKDDPHPAVRLAAKEVLVDAHLGAAQTIAFGDWKEKETAVKKWLGRAAGFADDLVKNDGGSREQTLHVNIRALAACVGLRGALDPSAWCKEATRIGDELIDASPDEFRKAQLQWDLGMALYDAVQVCQMRNDHQAALRYGQEAIEYLEQGERLKQPANAAYVMGKLYFRLGAIHAVREQNHRAAVAWFDKAVPLLEKPLPAEAAADLGRQGESLVSMGVSYWEAGQREKGAGLTEQGVHLMEQAVQEGMISETALAVPYGNLAAMNRQLGADAKADRFRVMASRIKESKVK
jgi:tetratricopeptide (TPR) repeat protein